MFLYFSDVILNLLIKPIVCSFFTRSLEICRLRSFCAAVKKLFLISQEVYYANSKKSS